MRGCIDPGITVSSPVYGVVGCGRINDPVMGPYPLQVGWDLDVMPSAQGKLSLRAGSTNPSQSEVNQGSWGFHTLRGGIDPWNHRVCPRVVEFVHILKGS